MDTVGNRHVYSETHYKDNSHSAWPDARWWLTPQHSNTPTNSLQGYVVYVHTVCKDEATPDTHVPIYIILMVLCYLTLWLQLDNYRHKLCCWCSLTDKQGPTRPSVCWCTVKWYWSQWVEYIPFGGSCRLTTEIIPQTATLPKVFMFASTVPNHSPPTYVHARISTEIYYSIRVYAS